MERIDDPGDDQAMAMQELNSPELAWDCHQRRFVITKVATWWRVCRKPPRGGRAKPMNGPRGPLHIPIDADFEALSLAVNHVPGWYVLNATDRQYALLPDIPTAHVEVVPEAQAGELVLNVDPPDGTSVALQRVTDALKQSLMASAQREQAMLAAFTEMATNVYSGFAEVQQSTAAMITAVQGGFDIASGVSLQKVPPLPEQPEAPPQKSFLEFLCSPAGNTAISALGGVLKAAVDDK